MYSISVQNYIQTLTQENINYLYFPDLNMTDTIPILNKMKLYIMKEKIINFKLDNYPTTGNSMFYNMEAQFTAFIADLDSQHGIPFEIKLKYPNPEKANKIIAERTKHINKFKQIMIYNSNFIIHNRDDILAKIDSIYNEIASKVEDELKIKRKAIGNEIITCECGATSYRKNLSTHKKSKRHQLYEALKLNEELINQDKRLT